jgi:hypothetical protein
MEFSHTEEQRILRQEIVRFCRNELNPGVLDRDREGTFSRELWARCAGIGLTGLPVPVELGGAGLDPVSTAMALEAFGYGCQDGGLVFSVCAHLLSCVVPIWKHGTDEQRRRYLPGLCDGTLIGVHGMTEPDSGSDAFALATRAVPDGQGFRLHGAKIFISNGPVADLVIVFAATQKGRKAGGGITAFLVDAGVPGFRRSQKFEKMGLRTSPLGEIVLEDVRVGPEAILGAVGGGATLFTQAMDWERVCLFASHVGQAERLMEEATQYARGRSQFGQPIGKFQAVAHKIADMKIRLDAARLLTYRAAWNLDRSKGVSLDAAVTKVFTSESLVKTAMDTVQVFGGYGYVADYHVERILRDAVASTIYSGTNEMQRSIIARWLGL